MCPILNPHCYTGGWLQRTHKAWGTDITPIAYKRNDCIRPSESNQLIISILWFVYKHWNRIISSISTSNKASNKYLNIISGRMFISQLCMYMYFLGMFLKKIGQVKWVATFVYSLYSAIYTILKVLQNKLNQRLS